MANSKGKLQMDDRVTKQFSLTQHTGVPKARMAHIASLPTCALWLSCLLMGVTIPVLSMAQSGDSQTHQPTGLTIVEFAATDDPVAIADVFLGSGLAPVSESIQINDSTIISGASLPAFGRFSSGLSAIGIDEGIVITANAKSSVFAGPLIENGDLAPFQSGWEVDPARVNASDAVLDAVLNLADGDTTKNATSLQFQVVPTERYLKFEYVLAVTEGGHFSSGAWSDDTSAVIGFDDQGVLTFIDGFGLFVDDLSPAGNFAKVPGTNQSLNMSSAGLVPLSGSSTDREANRNAALTNLANWRADNTITLGSPGNEIAYFTGSVFPDQAFFDEFFYVVDFAVSGPPDDRDAQFNVDWAIQFATVPLTAVVDICEGQSGSQCAATLSSKTPITVRIAIADAIDEFVPPVVFIAANSVRFENNPSAAPSLGVVLTATEDTTFLGNARVKYGVQLRDSVGNPVNAEASLSFALRTAPIGGTFFDALTGGSAITTITIPQGASQSADFYFEAASAGSYTVIASSTLDDAQATIIVEASSSSQDVADALAVLSSFTSDHSTEPSAEDYETIGVIITAADVAGINTIIQRLDSRARDTAEKIQIIVDIYEVIKTSADGDADNTPGLTAAQFNALGIPSTETPFTDNQAALLNELLGTRQPEDVSTFEALRAISDVVIKVFGTRDDAEYSPAMTVADFEVLGVTGVTQENLTAVLKALGPDGAGTEPVNNVADIQTRVNRGIPTLDEHSAKAEPIPVPILSVWTALLMALLMFLAVLNVHRLQSQHYRGGHSWHPQSDE